MNTPHQKTSNIIKACLLTWLLAPLALSAAAPSTSTEQAPQTRVIVIREAKKESSLGAKVGNLAKDVFKFVLLTVVSTIIGYFVVSFISNYLRHSGPSRPPRPRTGPVGNLSGNVHGLL